MTGLDDLFELAAAEQLLQAEREDKEKAARFAALPKEEQDRILAAREATAAQLCGGIDVTRYNDDDNDGEDDDEIQD